MLAITWVFGGTPWPRVDCGSEKMKSPPRLGLGTINIVPFVEGLIYYQSTCLEFRYGDGKVLEFRSRLPLIVFHVLIPLKTHSIL